MNTESKLALRAAQHLNLTIAYQTHTIHTKMKTVFSPQRFFRRDRIIRQISNPIPRLPNGPDPKYRYEEERLRSFDDRWTVEFIDYRLLARIGMYFIGLRDCVTCHFCSVSISEWQADDDPVQEHLKYSPNCPLMHRHRTQNVPLDVEALNRILPPRSPDECGVVCLHADPLPMDSTPVQVVPAFPDYALAESRMITYREWPRIMQSRVPDLVEAGFFYTGRGDHVQCFSCGVTIKDWEEDDDPWVQHAVWQRECKYLELLRDRKFIDESIAQYEEKQKTSRRRTDSESTNPFDRQLSVASSVGDADSSNVCKLCFLEERNTVFLPCGHVVACAKCALSVDRCPVCRMRFTDINRLYFS